MDIIVDFGNSGLNYRAPYVKVREKLKTFDLGKEIVKMLDEVYHKEVKEAENKSIMLLIIDDTIEPKLMIEYYIDYMDTLLSKSDVITNFVIKAIEEVLEESVDEER